MLRTVIRLNVTLKRAVSGGISIVDFDKTSNGAKDYIALSHEILRFEGSRDAEKPRASFAPVQVPEELESALSVQERIGKTSAPDIKEVTFTIEAPAAKDIYIVGEFNDWTINDESRLGRREEGCWEKRMGVLQGRYRYKFVIDGEWKPDPTNPELEQNVFGTFDSIMKI